MFNVSSYEETHNMLMDKFKNYGLRTVDVEINEALGRVLGENLYCPEDLPPFDRSTMDGYAVRAEDTFGASSSLPAILDIAGKVYMGEYVDFSISKGETCSIPTGGMLPEGADSVVMVEYTEKLDDRTVLVEKSVSPGENVIKKGEDIKKGDIMFKKGHIIRPQDIGVLASAGIRKIKVLDRLKVAVISTGNEIVDPFEPILPGRIRDINTYSLTAAVLGDGMEPVTYGIVQDKFENLKDDLKTALESSDVVLLSGGSSVGVMDMTYRAIESLEDAEMLVHGVAVKPGKPTIIARVGQKAVFGLPGHPVSAFIIYHTVVSRFLKAVIGIGEDINIKEAFLSENYASTPGRDEFVMVRLIKDKERITAYPVYGKSGMMATMSLADGYIHIPASREGMYKDEKVKVYMF